ncbi:MAG: cellulase family glycosylhydrolase [Thermoleophilaceae bacterium]
MSRRALTGLCTLVASAACAVPAIAAPVPPFTHAGRWLTDADGRVFISHGVNLVYKVPPYEPSVTGFGDDDAAFLQNEGFNSVRLGVIYKAVEPQPGVYDETYLAKIAATAAVLEKHGVAPLLDFHQDMYNERFQGEGWPDWAVLDDGLPAQPQTGFPGNYIVQPALNRAFDNFWANAAGPGDVGIGDRYAHAWKQVGAYFAGDQGVLGYDLINEPWPGSGWQQCAQPAGCPEFDQGVFAAFYRRTIKALREGDPAHVAFYEPNVIFNDGADTQLPKFDDKQLGMSWHNYCLFGDVSGSGGGGGQACQTEEGLVFQNAQKRWNATGDASLLTEFGATDDLDTLRRIADGADTVMAGWQYWAYCGCSDPTTQGPGETQAIVKDPTKPPAGDNLKTAKLAVLVRPYPQLVAGTPKAWSYDEQMKAFHFDYATARAGGGAFVGRPLTEVFVPARQYGSGYAAHVVGGTIVSKPGDETLLLAACGGAKDVKLTVQKAGASSVDCAAGSVAGVKAGLAKLRVTVRPRSVRAGRRTRFHFRVAAGRFEVHGARIRFAGHAVRTDGRGRATIRVALRRAGFRHAVAWKRTFRHGAARVHVLPRR